MAKIQNVNAEMFIVGCLSWKNVPLTSLSVCSVYSLWLQNVKKYKIFPLSKYMVWKELEIFTGINVCTRVSCQLWPPVPLPVPAAEGLLVGLCFRAAAAVELLQVFVQSWRQERTCHWSKKRPQHVPSTGVCLYCPRKRKLNVFVTDITCLSCSVVSLLIGYSFLISCRLICTSKFIVCCDWGRLLV